MSDYAATRRNMIDNQIRPNKVSDGRVLQSMAEVPRELFVPKRLRGVAYIDEDIAVAPGRYLMEPMILARLLQAAAITPNDVVLDIGCATGYSTAVLSRLAATVVAVESDPELAERASNLLSELDGDNAVVVSAPLVAGYARQAPYDVIVLGGAVEEVPTAITDQLAPGGRLVAVITGATGVGKGTLAMRMHGGFSHRAFCDAAVPPLPGFRIERGFVF